MGDSTDSPRDWIPVLSAFGRSESSGYGRGRMFSRLMAAAVAVLGFLGFLGWILDVDALKSTMPGLVTMKFNTALGLMLAGITVGIFLPSRKRSDRMSTLVVACVLTTMGLLTMVEYLGKVNLGIDQWLFKDLDDPEDPGRMSPLTALCFILAGAALLSALHRRLRLSQRMSLMLLMVSMVPLVGYILDVSALDQIKQLKGMIPVCAWCKKVRADPGYWQTLEAYLTAHTDATITHGICPTCFESAMPSNQDAEHSHLSLPGNHSQPAQTGHDPQVRNGGDMSPPPQEHPLH